MPEFPPIETDSAGSPAAAPESARAPIWFAPMATYTSDEYSFTIKYPADWERIGEDVGVAASFGNNRDASLVVIANPAEAEDFTFDEFVEKWRSTYELGSDDSDLRLISNTRFGEINGLPAQLFVLDSLDGRDRIVALFHVSEGGAAFLTLFLTYDSRFDEFIPIIEYSLRSITVNGNKLTNAPDFPGVEKDLSSTTVPSTESAPARGRFMPMATYSNDEYRVHHPVSG